jgi:hypothetical protein
VLDEELVLVLVLLVGEEILILGAVGVQVLGVALVGDVAAEFQLLVAERKDSNFRVLQQFNPSRVVGVAIELDVDPLGRIQLEFRFEDCGVEMILR